MRQRLVAALAGVPGARAAARTLRRGRSRASLLAQRPRHRALAGLVAAERDGEDAAIAVIGPHADALAQLVRARSPRAVVTAYSGNESERHVAMVVDGPFDVVVDLGGTAGRLRRFEATLFHLRPGGILVVPGGAVELGPHRGDLGVLLDTAGSPPEGPGTTLGRLQDFRDVVGRHVTHRVVGKDLLLTHDARQVLAKLREPEFNDYLRLAETPHRLLRTLPAEEPPPAPEGGEGPVPRRLPMHRPISSATISLREYRDVRVAPKQVLVGDRVLLPDTFRHNQWPHLVHSRLVDHGARFARPKGRVQAASLPRLSGTYLHLDNEFRGHFGHLLTETLSRVWSWPEALAIDPDARVLVGTTSKRPRPLDYELELYEACGIPRDRIDVIDRPVLVDRLISGTPLFSHPDYVHPRIEQTWREVGDRLADQAEDRDWPRRFFVGRRSEKRACVNGAEVEAIFAEYGFEVVYPEDYLLGEQIRLFRAAEVAAGYAGSGLFQIAFVPEPTHVIMVGPASYTPRNEYLMAAVHGHRVEAVICEAGGKGIQTSYSFDAEREGPYLRSLLERLP
ncbi:glycosyltransferase 61 family protein [Nocardioides sp. W7]|uniref:glycosyltransferase family 61 protein n=1 Tax=Nocardioides sp. W7 TaxID=2931390 RepID=UPI001FD3F7F3|nr:glycosyltransferase 61 family protein [Nocardioides sp. W7]